VAVLWPEDGQILAIAFRLGSYAAHIFTSARGIPVGSLSAAGAMAQESSTDQLIPALSPRKVG